MKKIINKIFLSPNNTLSEAINNLNNSGLQIIILTDENNVLIATVTDGDIRKGLVNGIKLNDKIIKVANLNPKYVKLNTNKNEIINLFQNFDYKALPVLDEDKKVINCHFFKDFHNFKTINSPFLIMAGGFGKRLGKLTIKCPKPMLKIDDKPILQHIIEKASKDGFTNIFISTHYLGHVIEDYFEDGTKFDVQISYIRESMPLGTAGCLKLMPKTKYPIVVTNGDLISKIGYKTILDYHCSTSASATMATIEYKIKHPYGVIKSEGINLIKFEEKPIWHTNINAGIYVLDYSVQNLIKLNEQVSMPDIFTRFQNKNKRVVIFPLYEKWIDIGSPKELKLIKKINNEFL